MKIGTIVVNGYASIENPCRYGVYLGGEKVMSFLPNGHPHISHYKGMLKDERFRYIGFIDLKGEIKSAMINDLCSER